MLLLGHHSAIAAEIDCGKARSTTERAICADPKLRAADAALATQYDDVRDGVAKTLAASLRDSQRRWLVQRARCPDAACIAARIAARGAVLAALAARMSDIDPLSDLNAVWLEGSWTVQSPTPSNLEPASDLPQPGSMLSFKPGELCAADGCKSLGLEAQILGQGPGGDTLPEALGLPANATSYLVSFYGKAEYELARKADGKLVAFVPGCAHGGKPCGWVQQLWRPNGPDSVLHSVDAASTQ